MRIPLLSVLSLSLAANAPVRAEQLPPLPDLAQARAASGELETPLVGESAPAGSPPSAAVAAAGEFDCVAVEAPALSAERAAELCREPGLSCAAVNGAPPAELCPRPRINFRESITRAAATIPEGALVQDARARRRSGPSGGERVFYWSSVGFVAGGTYFDAKSTADGIARGAREAGGPRIVGDRNTAGVILFSAGVQAAATTAIHYFIYKKGHPKLAGVLNLIAGSVHTAAAIHNRGVCPDGCR